MRNPKFMRMLFLFFVHIFFTKCSNQRINTFIPEEFNYPHKKIGAGKTFIYQNSSTNERSFKDLRSLNINGQHFQTIKSYNTEEVSDSTKILRGKTIEIYNFFMNKGENPIKAEIIKDTVVNIGRKIGAHLTKANYQTKELIYTTSSEEQFLRDSTLSWQGTQLPCLVTVANSKVEIKVKADTSLGRNMEVTSRLYFAKGIGLFQYSIHFTDQFGNKNYALWKLTSISDMKN